MASEAQIAANRRNAQRSTGPRAEEGKARTAQKGLKHGLCAAATVLPWEDRAEFKAMMADLTQRLQPADEIKLALLLQYAHATWRRQRCRMMETGMLADAMPADAEGCPEGVHPTVWAMGQAWMARSKEINRLSLHESRLPRLAERALDRLAAVQARRKQAKQMALDSKITESPSPAPAREGRAAARSGATASALTPDPHPSRRCATGPFPLSQERRREQDPGLAPELALLSRKAA
jgi:hypothetical protein